MPDLYETYVRTVDGDTYHPKDIREGIDQFLSDKGYRITFNIDGVIITIRRDPEFPVEKRHELLSEIDVHGCMVSIR